MEFLLTHKELKNLTGYTLARCQQRWLVDNGIKFYIDRFGRPKVVREVFNQLTGVRIKREPTPDFEALEALNG